MRRFLATAACGFALLGNIAHAQEMPADVSLAADIRTGLSGRVVLMTSCRVPTGDDDGGICPTVPVATTLGVRSADGSADIAQVATDADGQFAVALDPGQYQVLVPAPGAQRFPTQTLPVTVLADGPTPLTIQVRPSPHIVP